MRTHNHRASIKPRPIQDAAVAGAAIDEGHTVLLPSEAHAVDVLRRLGLTDDEINDRLRFARTGKPPTTCRAASPAEQTVGVTSSGDPFRREQLQARGFSGFIPFLGLDANALPREQGVYVVLREKDERPRFLRENPAGRFKGQDPTVPVDELKDEWPDGAHCVYIGKASAGSTGKTHLQKRLMDFRKYGDGKPVGHQGGRRIWQLTDADQYTLAWLVTPERDPEEVETDLLREFISFYGKRPIGNRTSGRRS